ncbi:MAG: hypothetical protein JWM16_2 [Verrucomicrobiales bacterium]|nr:hypothetical protein [Verrucomicrobiales bacterium]
MSLEKDHQRAHSRRRVIWLIGVIVILGVAVLGWQKVSKEYSTQLQTRAALDNLMTNPVEFARTRVMGGMGVSLGTNLVTGLPVINSMLIDSPAQKASLQVGDTIVKVNGMSTIGRSLEEVRRKAHGFAYGKISITVLRSQSNLVECVVHRNSWNKLRELTSNPYE